MRIWIAGLLGLGAIVAAGGQASAASLQVSPIHVEVAAPGAAAAITIRNSGPKAINAQIRVFKWEQREGRDELIPTVDVVASPPATALLPNQDYTIRIVRQAKAPVVREESYRLLVDELPDAAAVPGATVKFVLRHSIPVFFSAPGRADHQLSWVVESRGGSLRVAARNNGERRARIASLRIMSQSGQTVVSRDGLVGYVLGRSVAVWSAPAKTVPAGSTVLITAQGDDRSIRAEAMVRADR